MVSRVKLAKNNKEVVSIAYLGNVVDIWEAFYEHDILIDLGSYQTSLHNPWSGGYYPACLSFEESNIMMADKPEEFKKYIKISLIFAAVFIGYLYFNIGYNS